MPLQCWLRSQVLEEIAAEAGSKEHGRQKQQKKGGERHSSL
jgi:hypothetical protein